MKSNLNQVPVLVTGASGFIGQHLVRALLDQGAIVTILSRLPPPESEQRFKTIVGNLTNPSTLRDICRGVKTVFHLGGYAHAVDELDGMSARMNWEVTVEGTRALVEQSIKSGVSQLIFYSSVKAIGEGGEAYLDEVAACNPVSSYGKAKRAAEKLVLEAGQHGVSPTVLRLPMVYGPGCKGNLQRMIQTVARGRFPPLPDTGNKRSMVDVRDVVQATMLAVMSPIATGQIYIVTDGQAYTSRQIYEWICTALGRAVPRWEVPLVLLRIAAYFGDIVGRVSGRRFILDSDALDKLLGSAWYNSEKISRELSYKPAYQFKNSLLEMVVEFGMNR